MEFILKPVKEKKEYIKVNLGFTLDNHDHLPIIWRNSDRSFYGGFAYWDSKVCIVNFHVLYNCFLYFLEKVIDREFVFENAFLFEFYRLYYHEFLHLFFKFRANELKDEKGMFYRNEEYIDSLAKILSWMEMDDSDNWGYKIFEGEI